jgi:hypothetical protein
MKIELALSHIESRAWKGLCLIDGELMKVVIFPGSATEEWQAEIQPHLFVELTDGNKLKDAIERASASSQKMTRVASEMDKLCRLMEEHPELAEEITKVLRGEVAEEIHVPYGTRSVEIDTPGDKVIVMDAEEGGETV